MAPELASCFPGQQETGGRGHRVLEMAAYSLYLGARVFAESRLGAAYGLSSLCSWEGHHTPVILSSGSRGRQVCICILALGHWTSHPPTLHHSFLI